MYCCVAGHRTLLSVYPDAGLGVWSSETGGRWNDRTGLAQAMVEYFAVDLVCPADFSPFSYYKGWPRLPF